MFLRLRGTKHSKQVHLTDAEVIVMVETPNEDAYLGRESRGFGDIHLLTFQQINVTVRHPLNIKLQAKGGS